LTGYGKIAYYASSKLMLGIEYTLLRNRVKMPGGLTDDQFEENSKASVRSRNWLTSPWNVLSASMHYTINKNTSLNIKSTFLSGQRNLVWLSDLPNEADVQDAATGQFENREIDKEAMKSLATEARLLHSFEMGKITSTLATGIRFATASFHRQEDAPGTNGSNFDLKTTGLFSEDFSFGTTNFAAFVEDYIKLNNRFSVTPGIRYESLISEVDENEDAGGNGTEPELKKERNFLLLGLGLQYDVAKNAHLFGNISQSYRPVDYAQLMPFSTVTKVDPDMKDPRGWNADIGIRGNIKGFLNYDIGFYYLNYNNRIGLLYKSDSSGSIYTLRTNIDKSIHKGMESYIELNVSRALQLNKNLGDISVYNSFAYTNAKYTRGVYKNNQVEYAPEIINRIGCSFSKNWFKASLQFSNQSASFSDAANTVRSINPVIGRIPGYTVFDFSTTISYNKFRFKGGVNNLTDKRYFTQRTDEYPGPGIIPSNGRSFYIGIGYNL
jgi:Fe(3+) dicitrate transport protein